MKEKTVSSKFDLPSCRGLGFFTRFCLFFPPAFLLSVKFDLPHIFILVLLLLAVPCFLTRSFELKERPVVYSALLIAVLAFLPGLIVKIPSTRQTFVDYLLRSHIFLPFILYMGIATCWFRRGRGKTSLILLISLVAALICSDIFSTADLENTVFPGTTYLLRHYGTTYLVCVVFQCIGCVLLLTSGSRYDMTPRPKSLRVVRVAVIILMPFLILAARHLLLTKMAKYFRWSGYYSRVFMRNRNYGTSIFPIRAGISRPPSFDGEPQILVHAIGTHAPGYLRGKAYSRFSEYDGGTWFSDGSKAADIPEVEIEKDLSVLSFSLSPDWVKDSDTLEIRFLSLFSGDVIPFPTAASSITLDAKNVSYSVEGNLVPDTWVYSSGCIFTMMSKNASTASQYPGKNIMVPRTTRYESYLEIPLSFKNRILNLALEIIGGVNPESMSGRERVNAVTRYFAKDYEYSLSPSDKGGQNSLTRFLFTEKKGHCELFASASAMLLRALGIPTRYVVGIVCNDYHPSGFYYGTDRDLHAWAEAWLEDEEKWVMVESTPSAEIGDRSPAPNLTEFDVFMGKIGLKFNSLLYWIRRGYPARAVSNAWFAIYYGILNFSSEHPVFFTLVLVVLFGTGGALFWYIRMREIRRYKIMSGLRKAAKQIEELQKNSGAEFPRKPYEPLRTWALKLERQDVLDIVDFYESLRFSGRDCSEEELQKLKDMVKTVRKK